MTNRVVVITGASSGFGKGAALAFASQRDSVVLAARRGVLLDDLVQQCERAGASALAVPTDVSSREEVERLAKAAIDQFGRIDVWVNDAGVGAIGPFERVPLELHEQVIRTDLFGTLYGSYCAYQQFLKQGGGVLINIASELGKHTVPYYTSYAAAKHGVVGLGDALRQEIDQQKIDNVHVCTVMPTAHDTPFFDHVANFSGHEVQAPKPLHDPQDVVETIVRLAANPKDSDIVGGDGHVKILMKNLMPGIAEKMAGKMMEKTQMDDDVPPAQDTAGAVREPTREGTEIDAGRRQSS